jgi:hypothetical protein
LYIYFIERTFREQLKEKVQHITEVRQRRERKRISFWRLNRILTPAHCSEGKHSLITRRYSILLILHPDPDF